MTKGKTVSKPRDLAKGASKQTSPELNDRDLAKVSGGLTLGGVEGESTKKDHKDTLG